MYFDKQIYAAMKGIFSRYAVHLTDFTIFAVYSTFYGNAQATDTTVTRRAEPSQL